MDQEPTKESGAADTSPATNPAPGQGVDPRSLILPNKEVHSPLNAQRIHAGDLYNQEKSATLPLPPPPPPLLVVEPEKSDSVRPLETYQGDIDRYVRSQNITPVKAVAAEQKRLDINTQQLEAAPEAAPKGKSVTLQFVAFVGGLVLMVAAGGAFVYAYIHSRPLPQQQNEVAPYIVVDSISTIEITATDSRDAIMQVFQTAKTQVKLSLGLVAQLKPLLATTGQQTITAQKFFGVMTPNIPPQLLRAIQPEFLIGVHSFDLNQPFLIFSVDSYQGGYAGMLVWEKALSRDLSPLFDYTPIPRIPEQIPGIGSSTTVIVSPFIDTIVENHDARTIKNTAGDISLLWTFLDRNTILITTNVSTVREVIKRLKEAPKLTAPGL